MRGLTVLGKGGPWPEVAVRSCVRSRSDLGTAVRRLYWKPCDGEGRRCVWEALGRWRAEEASQLPVEPGLQTGLAA